MKNVLKKISKWLLIFTLFISLLFWIWYTFKIKRDLVNYNIPEKLIVKLEGDNNSYMLNLNNGTYSKYDWKYNNYWYNFEVNWDNDNDAIAIHNRKIYNQDNTYYFDYRLRIYNQNNKEVYRYINSWFFEAYWSQNWKYVISRNWYIARMFWLFLSIETANSVITIVEPETWKMKQLILWKPWERFINIEKILWYIK